MTAPSPRPARTPSDTGARALPRCHPVRSVAPRLPPHRVPPPRLLGLATLTPPVGRAAGPPPKRSSSPPGAAEVRACHSVGGDPHGGPVPVPIVITAHGIRIKPAERRPDPRVRPARRPETRPRPAAAPSRIVRCVPTAAARRAPSRPLASEPSSRRVAAGNACPAWSGHPTARCTRPAESGRFSASGCAIISSQSAAIVLAGG
jgi:hypothetical protein